VWGILVWLYLGNSNLHLLNLVKLFIISDTIYDKLYNAINFYLSFKSITFELNSGAIFLLSESFSINPESNSSRNSAWWQQCFLVNLKFVNKVNKIAECGDEKYMPTVKNVLYFCDHFNMNIYVCYKSYHKVWVISRYDNVQCNPQSAVLTGA
jgi:hypothetical protein